MPPVTPPRRFAGRLRLGAVVATVAAVALLVPDAVAQASSPATSAAPSIARSANGDTSDDAAELAPGLLPTRAELNPVVPRTGFGRRARGQCQQGNWGPESDDYEMARSIMRGAGQIRPFGIMRLGKNPSWRRQGSLDASGNGLMGSLHWTMPLLRVGMKTGNRAMVRRFYYLVEDWIRNNPPHRPRQSDFYGQIESGFRMLTLSCALAGPAPHRRFLVKAMREQGRVAARRWRSVNNTSFHQASGIFAIGCSLGDSSLRRKGLRFMKRISRRMIEPDGSVHEGSLNYSRNTYIWTQQEIARVRACSAAVPPSLVRSYRIPAFITAGTRPDRRMEAIGDGGAQRNKVEITAPGSQFRYAVTGGSEGVAPTTLFSRFRTGFIFGRSGWGTQRPFNRETFYSVRTGPGPAVEYHAHRDAGALTVASGGSQLLFDAGQYRYARNAAAGFIRSRAAHNVLSVQGVSPVSTAPRVDVATSSLDGDFVRLRDYSYRGVGLQRIIWYDRVGGFFVVQDDIASSKTRTVFQNWNLGRDRSVAVGAGTATTTGAGANLSIVSIGSRPGYSSVSGSRDPWRGWNSQKYGELVRSPSVHVKARAGRQRLVTVLIPRGAGVVPEAVGATGNLNAAGAQLAVTTPAGVRNLQVTSSGVVELP
ncbi:MAG: heparinase II/III domain-containing protein [Candidatus Nanopelagicales bacterium]